MATLSLTSSERVVEAVRELAGNPIQCVEWLEARVDEKRREAMKCGPCEGRGRVETTCGDPQCGDSTWDHDCGEGAAPCSACKGTGRRAA
jgi:hypothetical protein